MLKRIFNSHLLRGRSGAVMSAFCMLLGAISLYFAGAGGVEDAELGGDTKTATAKRGDTAGSGGAESADARQIDVASAKPTSSNVELTNVTHTSAAATSSKAAGSSNADRSAANAETSAGGSATLSEAECRKLLAGRWKQVDGTRVMQIDDDGTGSIYVNPDGVWAYMLGSQLRIDYTWTLEGNCFVCRVTGGSSEKKVSVVKQVWGEHWNREVLELAADRLVLSGDDGEPEHRWERAAAQ